MKTILSFVATLAVTLSFSQAPYVFSTYTSDYVEIQDGTPITEFDYDDDSWDDPEFNVPFMANFEILGNSYSSTTQADYGGLMGFLDDNGEILHAFGTLDDLIDGNIIEGAPSSDITYVSHTTPEYTETIIQFSNVAFYSEVFGSEPAAENRMSFQIHFYTPSNAMSIHFGPSNIPNPLIAFEGNNGPTLILAVGADPNLGTVEYGVAITGDPDNPVLTELSDFDEYPPSLDSIPSPGRVYRFEPATSGIAENEKPLFSINPTLTSEFIWVAGDIKPNSTYRIFDLSGKEVLNGQLNVKNAVDVSNLQSGFYLFSIDGMTQAVKFLKTE